MQEDPQGPRSRNARTVCKIISRNRSTEEIRWAHMGKGQMQEVRHGWKERMGNLRCGVAQIAGGLGVAVLRVTWG
jgi:hypothetical protein